MTLLVGLKRWSFELQKLLVIAMNAASRCGQQRGNVASNIIHRRHRPNK